jgi:hypothetical protein
MRRKANLTHRLEYPRRARYFKRIHAVTPGRFLSAIKLRRDLEIPLVNVPPIQAPRYVAGS